MPFVPSSSSWTDAKSDSSSSLVFVERFASAVGGSREKQIAAEGRRGFVVEQQSLELKEFEWVHPFVRVKDGWNAIDSIALDILLLSLSNFKQSPSTLWHSMKSQRCHVTHPRAVGYQLKPWELIC